VARTCKALPVSTANLVSVVLGGVAVVELGALIVVGLLWLRSRREVATLRVDATRRSGPRTITGRAVRAAVGTAVRLRDHGVGGLLAATLDDLTRWSTEDRAEIAKVASPDGTVTIFFSDIEGSTALNEQFGDARWMRVLEDHNHLVTTGVEKRHGHVVKTQGDGFMVVFGDPGDAVRASIAIQRALAGRRFRRAEVKVRIGIHVGRVVSREGDYFGRNVAMAARVAAQAEGADILISDDVREALGAGEEFTLVECDEVELKGLADRHVLWSVKY
jgi:adenylate cyclase